jgi:hypothetical protein
VFFMCPGIAPGIYNEISIPKDIHVISLGCDMLKR